MSVNTSPLVTYLAAYGPRVTLLPFTASLWFEGRFGFALMLTLVWHFVVAVPWQGLANVADPDVQLAYFVILPIMAVSFALLGFLLQRLLLLLPWHLTPVGHAFSSVFRDKCRPREDDVAATAVPHSYLISHLLVSLVVVAASWLPSELMTFYGYSHVNINGPLFWVTMFVPPGAVLLPLVLWLGYGEALENLFGAKHRLWNVFKTFLKLFTVTAVASVAAALVAKYATAFWIVWTIDVCVAVAIGLGALVYYVLQHRTEKVVYA